MQKTRRILCYIDAQRRTHTALRRAAWLARRAGASIELLGVCYNDYLLGHPLFDAELLQRARDSAVRGELRRLERLAAPLRKAGLDVTSNAIWDHPLYEGIVREACTSRADIVLKDTQRHTVFDVATLSNTDWNLIRSCPVPLWLVKRRELPDPPRLIASIDPMHAHDKPAALDDAILRMSNFVAGTIGGEVHAFHSFDPRLTASFTSLNAYVASSMRKEDIQKEFEEQHRRRFNEVAEFHDIAAGRAHMTAGFVHRELPALAKSLDASIVVMGAVNRNRLGRLFIGSTAERTLDRLPCDLLIVKPDWFKTPVRMRVDTAA
jgi:universal stress protein E